jgi:hypothetical protein
MPKTTHFSVLFRSFVLPTLMLTTLFSGCGDTLSAKDGCLAAKLAENPDSQYGYAVQDIRQLAQECDMSPAELQDFLKRRAFSNNVGTPGHGFGPEDGPEGGVSALPDDRVCRIRYENSFFGVYRGRLPAQIQGQPNTLAAAVSLFNQMLNQGICDRELPVPVCDVDVAWKRALIGTHPLPYATLQLALNARDYLVRAGVCAVRQAGTSFCWVDLDAAGSSFVTYRDGDVAAYSGSVAGARAEMQALIQRGVCVAR